MTTNDVLIAMKSANTREKIANVYASALRYGVDVDWPAVNTEILAHYKLSGLSYIKKRAWKQVTG